ncbi:methyltransferase domain-containing protein [Kitasatospora brasiliensis]|uniref:methyltransferase domain-containing protein n=1 Tax=Kitasatospora brasiliensis TaxID=3058040 RepID=UPI00292D45A0|nr:methyltransferase domain-containing protein [Kitasatospora sp. K002]
MSDEDLTGRRARLDAEMEQHGAWPADSPWLREAFAALPRDGFAPDRLWRWDGWAYLPLDRAVDPDGWAGELYSGVYAAAITQLADDRPSSSLSAPFAVADMLDSLRLEPGHQVWDIGTGQGWTAALASWRAGPGRVVSTEVDERLAAFARTRLAAAGLDTEVTVADGTADGPPGGLVDRVHATYAVEAVPWSWVTAVRPGGRIVYPWGRLGHVALTVADDGQSATGWVQGLAQFMGDRHAPAQPNTSIAAYTAVRGDAEPETRRKVDRDPAPLDDDWDLRFALRVAVPDAVLLTGRDEDGVNAWIHDGHQSWATLTSRSAGSPPLLLQGGPRRIGDEVLAAWAQWEDLGRPDRYDYGITVTPAAQWAWQGGPDGPRWAIGERALRVG